MIKFLAPRTLLTTDLHISGKAADAYRWKIFPWLSQTLKQYEIDRLIILGDLTEQKDGHTSHLVNKFVSNLVQLGQLCDIVIIRGNHDGLTPETPFFAFTDKLRHISWISLPRRIGNEMFLPHTLDYREWEDYADDFKDCSIFYCHQTFVGAVSEQGYKFPGGVPLDLFPRGARIYSGDIHKPQTIGHLTYVGAPYTIRYGDNFDPRVILLEGDREQSIPVPGVQKRLIDINSPSQLLPQHANPQDLVKIRVHLTGESCPHWSEYREEIAAFCAKQRWNISAISPITEHKLAPKVATQAMHVSDTDLIRAFAKRQGLGAGFLKAGLEFSSSDRNTTKNP